MINFVTLFVIISSVSDICHFAPFPFMTTLSYNKYLCALIILLATFRAGGAQTLAGQNDEQCQIPGISAQKVAVYIEDLRSGEVLVDIDAEEPMIPASVTKLVTAATVIHQHKLDERYSTDVLAVGKLKDGVLHGNIIVKACGDPTVESDYFAEYKGFPDSIAVAASRLGIGRINGRVIIDCPRWLSEPIPSGWERSDVNYPYGAGHHAMNFADNRITLTYRSPDNYSVSPATPDIVFKPVSGKHGVSRNPGDSVYNVSHKGKKPLSVTLANPLPHSSMRHAIESKLTAVGIEIDSLEIDCRNPVNKVYSHLSPPICDILKSLIIRSDNQMAEAMLRYAWPGIGRSRAAKNGIDSWMSLGVNMNDVFLEDGSGLSRKNRLTAYALADLLVWMIEKEPEFPRFLQMLPRAGQTGTMKSFLKDTPLEGRLWAKTGSMNGIQSYAGYVVDEQGTPSHVVVIMVNGFKGDRASLKNALKDMLLEKLFPPDQNSQFDIYD